MERKLKDVVLPTTNVQNWSNSLASINSTYLEPNLTAGDDNNYYFTRTTELYVVIGLLSFLSALGAIGNSIVIYVFLRKRDRLVSTHFILVLAFVDLITCVIVIPYTITMEYIGYLIQYDLLCKIYQFLITSNIPFSALIMVAIAIDRYLCICHPFLRALNIPRAKVMTALLATFSIIIGIIVSLMFGVYHGVTREEYERMVMEDPYYDVMDIGNPYGITLDKGYSHNNSIDTMATHIPVNNNNTSSIHNITIKNANLTQYADEYVIIYYGYCVNNTLILSRSFQWHYQKVYTAMYMLCLIIVIILYSLIYKSVLERRTKRQRQKSKVLCLVQNDTTAFPVACEDTIVTATNENHVHETSLTVKSPQENCGESNGGIQLLKKPSKIKSGRRKSTKRDKMMRIANLKTAGMLFVVTVVFIVTFLPAFLMTNNIIPYNIIVFYLYFANNVANPVIYSFMNKNFRDDLHKIFCA